MNYTSGDDNKVVDDTRIPNYDDHNNASDSSINSSNDNDTNNTCITVTITIITLTLPTPLI